MTCYHPKIRIEMIGKTTRAADGHLYHPAVITTADKEHETLENIKKFSPNYKKQIIPCRTCIGCRLDYARDWANRGFLEAKKSDHNYFVTLTYDEAHLPKIDKITTKEGKTYENNGEWNGILKPEHLRKFIHDIRQHYWRKSKFSGIKYLACGEYGTENKRPHYHIIFFNLPLESNTFYNSRIIDKEYFFQNEIIEKYWKKGISNVSTANWNTISYVCRYVTKKLYGNKADDEYAKNGQIPEFIRMSKGIGKDYWNENKEKILQTDTITIGNNKGVFTTKPPKYFNRLLKKENETLYNEIKEKREEETENMNKIKDKTHTYGRLGLLENEERTKLPKANTLKRDI